MRQGKLLRIAVALAGLSLASPALGAGWNFQPDKNPARSKPGKKVEKPKNVQRLPGSITLKRGRSASYKGSIGAAAVMDPSIADAILDEQGILTVKAKKIGSTKLMIIGGKNGIPSPEAAKNPRQISLRVVQ
ncbi:MAG TPA: hypothetical protein DFS52_21800 [Myxococcales bacterium]|jgi:hypothetical protein|nr:hypothetical protein [Myxococcales bacterium]